MSCVVFLFVLALRNAMVVSGMLSERPFVVLFLCVLLDIRSARCGVA